MKTITFGYRQEGLALHRWAFANSDLQAIVLPDNRLEEPNSSLIRWWARKREVPVLIHFKDHKEFAGMVKAYQPDLIICHCYTYLLSSGILKIPRLGCINIHPGKLPQYAGRSPIEAALKNGDKKLWVTLHFMDEGFDTGKIISEYSVGRNEGLLAMRELLTQAGLRMLGEWKRRLG